MYNTVTWNMKKVQEGVKRHLRSKLPDDVSINFASVEKTNGVVLTAVMLMRPGKRVAPTVYIEELMRRLDTSDEEQLYRELADIIINIDEMNQVDVDTAELEQMKNYDSVKDRIIIKLVNEQRNDLSTVPHLHLFADLAASFYIVLKISGGVGTVKVTDKMAAEWMVSTNELYQQALKNMPGLLPASFVPMQKFLIDMGKNLSDETGLEDLPDEELPMFILTNKQQCDGSATILYDGLLESVRERLGEDFWILPSSKHEVIIVPESDGEYDSLSAMVRTINKTEVEPMDYLSDQVLKYPQDFAEI